MSRAEYVYRRRFVYFIQPEGGGLIKIGSAYEPAPRLAGFQMGSPVPLRIIARCLGETTDEMHLHRRFKKHRAHGEWFHPDDEIMAFIASLASNPIPFAGMEGRCAASEAMDAKEAAEGARTDAMLARMGYSKEILSDGTIRYAPERGT